MMRGERKGVQIPLKAGHPAREPKLNAGWWLYDFSGDPDKY